MSRARAVVVSLFAGLTASAGAQAPTCPDSTETPALIAYTVEKSFQSWTRDPSIAVPPSCLYRAVAQAPLAYSDSTVLQTLELMAEALKRSPGDADNLAARLILLYRARQYAAVGPAFDSLFMTRPSRLTPDAYRLTVAAAMRLGDTTAIIDRLANASQRFGSAVLFAREYDVWRQLPRLRLVVDTVQRRIRKEPTLVEAYSILASVYGNLDQPDSALAYARTALRRGVRRPVVAAALESLIGRELRRAQLILAADVWQSTLPVALRIDSTLSTPASKYLVAVTLAELVADGARLAQAVGTGLSSGVTDGYSLVEVNPGGGTSRRVLTCDRVAELRGMITLSRERLAAGGDQFAPQTVPGIRSGLDRMTAVFRQLAGHCPP
jgi:hypothetical protein